MTSVSITLGLCAKSAEGAPYEARGKREALKARNMKARGKREAPKARNMIARGKREAPKARNIIARGKREAQRNASPLVTKI
jgi:hypothetical protein